MTKRHLTMATRESPLAQAQARAVKAALLQHHPTLSVALLGMTTEADRRLEATLLEIGGKGLFVKELEEALYEGRADIAVHSMKDVPMELPSGLILPVVLKRESPQDAFISNHYASLSDLPPGSRIGTSSLRRQTQLRALRPDLEYCLLRGNIHTRLRRLDNGDFAAIILAAAGLHRVCADDRISQVFQAAQLLPAAGQGALGIECRMGDQAVLELIAPLNDGPSFQCVMAERALCRRMGGGCRSPIGAYAEMQEDRLVLQGLIANEDGTKIWRASHQGPKDQAESIGTRVGEELLLSMHGAQTK